MTNCHLKYKSSCFYSIAALDSAKLTAENCEFERSFQSDQNGKSSVEEQTISATNSDLTVSGCYIHHGIAEEAISTTPANEGKLHLSEYQTYQCEFVNARIMEIRNFFNAAILLKF